MKKLCFLLPLFTSLYAAAQDPPRYLNVYGGAGRSSLTPAAASYVVNKSSLAPVTVAKAGIAMAWGIGENWHLVTGVEYLETGYQHDITAQAPNGQLIVTGTAETRLSHLLFPLEGRFHTDLGHKWRVGLQAGIAVGDNTAVTTTPVRELYPGAFAGRYGLNQKDTWEAFGRAKADVVYQLGRRFFLAAGPAYSYRLGHRDHHKVLSFDLGAGIGF